MYVFYQHIVYMYGYMDKYIAYVDNLIDIVDNF